MDSHIEFKFMITAFVLLIFIIAYIVFLHFFAKRYLIHPHNSSLALSTNMPYLESSISTVHQGLDPSVLKNIPILSFIPGENEQGMECAVCLTELTEGGRFRKLPKCHHGFHVDCVDMWFQSHLTCPLCRNPVSDRKHTENNVTTASPANIVLRSVAQGSDANLHLFSDNQLQVSTRTLSSIVVEDDTNIVTWEILSSSSTSSEAVAIDMPKEEVVLR